MVIDRRVFMATASAGALACYSGQTIAKPWSHTTSRKKIAFLGTTVHPLSHSQHFLDRHAMGYTWGGKWEPSRLDIASVFVDQFPANDLAKQRIEKYRLKSYSTIEEALTLGTSKLAVDGVVIIAEHGDYPANEKGQRLYPRYKWFKQVVKVFEDSGRSVPVFNDKHLSTTWDECVEMVDDSKRLDFGFLAGSSLPVTWRLPSIDMPWGVPLKESVCVGYGGVDSYDFHGLETAQCMSERRHGGEVGIASVHAKRGEKMWTELTKSDRETTRRLFVSALSRSHNLPVDGGYPTDPVSMEWAQRALPDTTAYFIEHNDGFRTTLFLAPISDFNYAGLRSDSNEVVSCQMYLPMPTRSATTADFFNPLARHIESLVLSGKAPYPVERTLLTSGMVIGGVDSFFAKEQLVATPQMKVAYQTVEESHFWRE
jgi:hypothetical protein